MDIKVFVKQAKTLKGKTLFPSLWTGLFQWNAHLRPTFFRQKYSMPQCLSKSKVQTNASTYTVLSTPIISKMKIGQVKGKARLLEANFLNWESFCIDTFPGGRCNRRPMTPRPFARLVCKIYIPKQRAGVSKKDAHVWSTNIVVRKIGWKPIQGIGEPEDMKASLERMLELAIGAPVNYCVINHIQEDAEWLKRNLFEDRLENSTLHVIWRTKFVHHIIPHI